MRSSTEPMESTITARPRSGRAKLNEFGELTGEVDTGVAACLFIDGGKVGEGKVYWSAGGDGGQGQQNVGSVDLAAPEYEGSDASGDQPAKAWIKDDTVTKVDQNLQGRPPG